MLFPFETLTVCSIGSSRNLKLNKWYTSVSIKCVPENNSWMVYLDDRMIISRHQKPFFLPTEELALLVASEWETQGEKIYLTTLPLTANVGL